MMTGTTRTATLRACAAVLCAGVFLAASPANAQDLFETLFGGQVKHRKDAGEFPPAPKPAQKKTVAAPKVSAPIYYTYKVTNLARVDFAALTRLPQTASIGPFTTLSAFREATSGLKDFDLVAEKDIGKALVDYYGANPDFIWVTGFSANGRAQEALRVFGEADGHGMVSADYAVQVPPAGFSMDDTASRLQDLIRFEMSMSARALRYMLDAQDGRINPNLISGYHDLPRKPLDMVAALKKLSTDYQVRDYLESFHPKDPAYAALRAELETLSSSLEQEVRIDPKLLLKPGETHVELPTIVRLVAEQMDAATRAEFADVISVQGQGTIYGPELVPFFKAAQKMVGLKEDGVIGPRTIAKLLPQSKSERLDKVRYALEQMRWLPSEFGATRVFINQPAFTASYFEDGVEKLTTRTVIGRPSNQTTFFYDEIEQVDYNPYWGVPQSIIVNEMLPRLRRDPGYLDRAGYEVTDAKGRRVSSSSVDWGAYGSKVPFGVRQAPSEANALGELKILFPNKHAIYMHDTPQKALFDRDSRAFSHGCVRLQDPRGMAAAVLGKSREYVANMLAKGHSTEKVTRKIPVYVAYFTAWPDQAGKVEYFVDVYDRDSHLKDAMEKTEASRQAAG